MIGHFPSPYPDESLYSLSARFSERVQYGSSKAILQELYGSETATAVTFLPNRLAYLAGALPRGTSLSVDCLIDRHTIFPLFGGFLPPERVERIRKDMASGNGAAVYMRAGCMASPVKMVGALRFCMACKLEDEAKFGETYWHRSHQLPGINICWQHETILQDSTATVRCGRNLLLFTSANTATKTIAMSQVKIHPAQNAILLQIARDAEWLLKNPIRGTPHGALQNRYLQLLIDKELATYTKSIHTRRLLAEFFKFYPQQLLVRLNCQFRGRDQQKTNWLLRLVRTARHSQHPLYHLLLIQFLGVSVQDFFHLPNELKFFGDGPWPCLNLAARHFREPVIQRCNLSKRTRANRPIGNFNCICGFAFARSGPDATSQDRYRIGRMISFGPTWEAKLKQVWKDSSLSLSEIGRRLGIDPLTVRRHATRLELPFSIGGRSLKRLSVAHSRKSRDKVKRKQRKRNHYRLMWRAAMERDSKSTMKTVRKRFPRVYAWLLQNDPEWMTRNCPKLLKKKKKANSSVDWKNRDSRYAGLVKQSKARITSAVGRPVRITRTAIGRDLGCVSLFQNHLHKLPVTGRVLASAIETSEEFSIRRVWWAASLYLEESICPQRWQLILRANVYRNRQIRAVKDAIQVIMRMLRSGSANMGAAS